MNKLNFGDFVNKKWEGFLNNMLGRVKLFNEMTLGAQNTSKMPILFGSHTRDQEFLNQVHPGILHRAIINRNHLGEETPDFERIKGSQGSIGGQALHQRYGQDMIDIGKEYDSSGKLPMDTLEDEVSHNVGLVIPLPGVMMPKKQVTIKAIMEDPNYRQKWEATESDHERNRLIDEKNREILAQRKTPVYIKYLSVKDKPTRTLFTGKADLARKLTNPAKSHEESRGSSLGSGPGLSNIPDESHPDYDKIKDAYESSKPKENHHGHGYYDFDLSNVQDPIEIDKIPDKEILKRLSKEKKKKILAITDKNIKEKFKQKAIAEKRKAMKRDLKRNSPGYDPLQKSTARNAFNNWIKLTSMGVLDKSLKQGENKIVKDPLTGQDTKLYWMPAEKAGTLLGLKGRDKQPAEVTAGFDANSVKRIRNEKDELVERPVLPGKTEKLSIPVIQREIEYQLLDINKKPITEKSTKKHVKIWVPYLPDMKAMPSLTSKRIPEKVKLTDQQRALIAHRNGATLDDKQLISGLDENGKGPVTIENIMRQWNEIMNLPQSEENLKIKKTVTNASTITNVNNLIKSWDILDEEQKEYIKNHTESLVNIAKAVHIPKSDEFHEEFFKDHPHAYPTEQQHPGWTPNKGKVGQSSLGTKDPETIEKIIATYYKQMSMDALAGIRAWVTSKRGHDFRDFRGKGDADQEDQKTEDEEEKIHYRQQYNLPEDFKFGKINEKGEATNGRAIPVRGERNVPDMVVKALEASKDSLTDIFAYLLITYLNDPNMGVTDDKAKELGLNLDPTKSAQKNNGFGAAKQRVYKIMREMQNLSQMAVALGLGSRRERLTMKNTAVQTHTNMGTAQGEEGPQYDISPEDNQKKIDQKLGEDDEPYKIWSARRHDLPKGYFERNAQQMRVLMKHHEVPSFLTNVASRIHIQLGGLVDRQVAHEQEKVGMALVAAQGIHDDFIEENKDKFANQEELEAAADKHLGSELEKRMEALGISKNDASTIHSQITALRRFGHEKAVSQDYPATDPNYIENWTEAVDDFYEKLQDDGEAELPVYDPELKKFVSSDKNVVLDRMFAQYHAATGNTKGRFENLDLPNIMKLLRTQIVLIGKDPEETPEIKATIKELLEGNSSVVRAGMERQNPPPILAKNENKKKLYEEISKLIPQVVDGIGMQSPDFSGDSPAPQIEKQPQLAKAAAPTEDVLQNYEKMLTQWKNVPDDNKIENIVKDYNQFADLVAPIIDKMSPELKQKMSEDLYKINQDNFKQVRALLNSRGVTKHPVWENAYGKVYNLQKRLGA